MSEKGATRSNIQIDFLTGLPARREFNRDLEEAMRDKVSDVSHRAVVCLDLDRFSEINDAVGHDMGDRVLQSVARRIAQNIKGEGALSRLGGDEFLLHLPCGTSEEALREVGRRIHGLFSTAFQVGPLEIHLTATVGVSRGPQHGTHAAALVLNAEVAMHLLKKQGGNGYRVYTPEMASGVSEKAAMEQRLRKAIRQQEFTLYFQPLVDAGTRRPIGFECLLRWIHPEWGLVSPGKFVPLAEETGLIVPLDEWVLDAACGRGRAWRQAGYPPVRLMVNVSAREFRKEAFLRGVGAVLERSGLEPENLEIEITEGVLMENPETVREILGRLRDLGVRVAIDDFGTGYSSLAYLKRFPVQTLKIDRSFVRELPHDRKDAAIVRSVMAMAHGLDLDVVAEGVENEEQAAFLIEEGCDVLQGFLIAKPAPEEEVVALLSGS